MDILKYRQIKRRARIEKDINKAFTAAEVKELVEIIQQHRKFIDHLLAYSTTGHTSMFGNLYDIRTEALRLKGLIEGRND